LFPSIKASKQIDDSQSLQDQGRIPAGRTQDHSDLSGPKLYKKGPDTRKDRILLFGADNFFSFVQLFASSSRMISSDLIRLTPGTGKD